MLSLIFSGDIKKPELNYYSTLRGTFLDYASQMSICSLYVRVRRRRVLGEWLILGGHVSLFLHSFLYEV